MTFEELKNFLVGKMKMSHIYQPVMIKHLIESNGSSSDKSIANSLQIYDPSQIEYYQQVTNKMVGKVLRSHQIVEKKGNTYLLTAFNKLSEIEKASLIEICNNKIDAYIKKRGDAIWSHRRRSREVISGTIRYEVLKRAQFRCELCGISANEKSLEVDHILPIKLGGPNNIHNYQALCYSCNAMKRDRDNTDFRGVEHKYHHREEDCLFCSIPKDRIVEENHLALVIYDKFPVTNHHALIIPKRHFREYFEINQAELNSVNALMQSIRSGLMTTDSSIKGFNVGINSGIHAGQTIMHSHIHLIPRREGDIINPRGGIRNVIPGKGDYNFP